MPNASILEDILQAMKTAITGLSLSGLASTSVIVQKTLSVRSKELDTGSLPAVLIAPWQVEQIRSATNLRDDIVYPIAVCIVGSDEQSQATNRDTWFGWRQSIRRKFHNNLSAFTSLSTVIESTIQPMAIVDQGMWFDRSLFVSGMLINALSREPRT